MNAYEALAASLQEAVSGLHAAAESLERLKRVQDRNTAALQNLSRVAASVARRLSGKPDAGTTAVLRAEGIARRAEWHMRAVELCFRPGHIRKRPRLLRSLEQVLTANAELRTCLAGAAALGPDLQMRVAAVQATLDRTDEFLRGIQAAAPSVPCIVQAGE